VLATSAILLLTTVLAKPTFEVQPVRAPLSGIQAYRTSVAVLFVGKDYEGESAFSNSAKELEDRFVQWEFPRKNIHIVQARSQADVTNELERVRQFTTNRDRVIVAFISHGVETKKGPVLKLSINDVRGDLPMNAAVSSFKGIKALHRLLILDACHSGDLSGLKKPQGTVKGMPAFSKKGSAVILSSARNKCSMILFDRTRFTRSFLDSAKDTRKKRNLLRHGIYLSDIVPALKERLPDGSLNAIAPDSAQMLLDPSFVSRTDDEEQRESIEYEDSPDSVNAAIGELRKLLLDTQLDAPTRAYLQLQLASTLTDQLVVSLSKRDIREAVDILQRLPDLEPRFEHERSRALIRALSKLIDFENPHSNLLLCLKEAEKLAANYTKSDSVADIARAYLILGGVYNQLAGIEHPRDNLHKATNVFLKCINLAKEALCVDESLNALGSYCVAYKELMKYENVGPFPQDLINESMKILSLYEPEIAKDSAYKDYITRFRSSLNRISEGAINADDLRLFVEMNRRVVADTDPNRGPYIWAARQTVLAGSYLDLSSYENLKDNLEKCIEADGRALTVFTKTDYPYLWAQTTMNRANVEMQLFDVDGDMKKPLRSMNSIQETIPVFEKGELWLDWAHAKSTLARINLDRFAYEKEQELLSQSIKDASEALNVYNNNEMSLDWASTQRKLAEAYSLLACVREPVKNYQTAIDCFRAALTVYNEKDRPEEWSDAQYLLGVCLQSLSDYENRVPNLKLASDAIEASLRYHTKENDPVGWAYNSSSLASIYLALAEDLDPISNLTKTIDLCDQAEIILKGKNESTNEVESYKGQAYALLSRYSGKRDDFDKGINFLELLYKRLPTDTDRFVRSDQLYTLARYYIQYADDNDDTALAEKALEYALEARKGYDQDKDVSQWSITGSLVGMCYLVAAGENDKPGSNKQYVDLAITAFNDSLSKCKDISLNDLWFNLKINLACALRKKAIFEDKPSLLIEALQNLEAIAPLATREKNLPLWVDVQHAKCACYYSLSQKQEKDKNLSIALECYNNLKQIEKTFIEQKDLVMSTTVKLKMKELDKILGQIPRTSL
jgi:tetratricopeptide (TPR) repeat protein